MLANRKQFVIAMPDLISLGQSPERNADYKTLAAFPIIKDSTMYGVVSNLLVRACRVHARLSKADAFSDILARKREVSRIGRRRLGETTAAGCRGPRFTDRIE